MRTCALLGMLALAGSCDVEFGHGCTEIGCIDQATLMLHPSDGRWAEGAYALSIDTGGQQFACEMQLPADLPERGSVASLECGAGLQVWLQQDSQCTETRSADSISQSCQPLDGRYTLQVTVHDTPAQLNVELTHAGQQVLDERVQLSYRTTRPNGPDCDPECKQASAERTW